MLKSILVPMGSTEHSFEALAVAVEFAEKAGAEIRGLYVRDLNKMWDAHAGRLPYATVSGSIDGEQSVEAKEYADRELESEEDLIRSKFEEITKDFKGEKSFTVETGMVAEVILLREKAADLIIMGRSRHADDPKTPPLGPTARNVIQKSWRSCLVISKGHRPKKSVLLAYGGGRPSGRALRHTAALAGLSGGEVFVVIADNNEEHASGQFETVTNYLRPYGIVPKTIFKKTDSVTAIVETVKEVDPGFVVMGAYGDNTVKSLIFGSTTEKIIEAVHRPLLLCS